MFKNSLILFGFLFLTFKLVWAGEGTSSLRILNFDIGARQIGMGGAFVSIADDVNTIHYNPAGLTLITDRELSFMYLKGMVDENYAFAGYSQPVKKIGTIGASIIHYDGGNIELNFVDGTSKTLKAEQDYVVTLSYSRSIHERISIGLGAKIIQSSLVEEYSVTSFGSDLGVVSVLKENLKFGLVVQNLGTGIKYKQETDPLPLTIRTGVSCKTVLKEGHGITGSLDIVKPNDESIKEQMGIEYQLKNMFALRIGYKIGYDLYSFTCGLGFTSAKFKIDYGFAPMAELNSTHRVSFTISF